MLGLDALRVVVITDRRLCPIEQIPRQLAAILAAVPRGAVLVQIREKDLDGGPLLHLARAVLEVAHPAGAPVWLNDRVDVALAAGADGAHLPERGLSVAEAREVAALLGKPLALGVSRHTPEAAVTAAREGAALVQLGPIWSTPSKEGLIAPLGLEALAVRRALAPEARLVAVGGIDRDRARLAAASGADAVAVIRAAWSTDAPAEAIAALVAAVDAGRAARG